MIAAFTIPELDPIRPQLIIDGHRELGRAQSCVEQMMLATALLRLGERVSPLRFNHLGEVQTFHFFIAGMLTAYEQPWLRRFAHLPIVHMRWQCEAHSLALVVEYLTITNSFHHPRK